MYVTALTTLKQIRNEIDRLENRLTVRNLAVDERKAIEEELDYLYSFLPMDVT